MVSVEMSVLNEVESFVRGENTTNDIRQVIVIQISSVLECKLFALLSLS